MKNWSKKQNIQIISNNGVKLELVGYKLDNLFIHKSEVGTGYMITHLPSSVRIFPHPDKPKVNYLKDIKKFSENLLEREDIINSLPQSFEDAKNNYCSEQWQKLVDLISKFIDENLV